MALRVLPRAAFLVALQGDHRGPRHPAGALGVGLARRFGIASRRAVCVPLSKEVEIGFVPTDAWGKYPFCRRPLSWYKASPLAGRILVVSSFDLDEYHFSPETIIQESDFKPPKLPDREGKLKLIEQESYQKAKPPEWENIDARP